MGSIFGVLIIASVWYVLSLPIKLENNYEHSIKLQSVSYAPFKYSESPKDLVNGLVIPNDRIESDIKLLSNYFNGIRIYSVSGLENILDYARKYNMQVLLGAWVCMDDEVTNRELQNVVKLAKLYPDVVSAVVVGNEVLLRREMSAQKLGNYIKSIKEQLPDTKVTYADVWEFWLQNKELAQLVDFVTIHILPFWEDNPVSVDDALGHIKSTMDEVSSILNEKEILIGETGWPSEGRMRGESLPSLGSQAEFIRGFLNIARQNGWNYNIIEAFDQPWKRASEGAVGGYWGLFDKDSNNKNIIGGNVREFSNAKELFFISIMIFTASIILLWLSNVMTYTTYFKNFSYSTISGLLLSLQINQYFIISKDIVDYSMATLYMVIMLTIYIYTINIYLKVLEQKLVIRWFEISRVLMVCLILVETFGIFIDGRYRSFPNYGVIFVLFSIILIYASKINIQLRNDSFDKLASVIIIISSFGIIYNEGILNIQALGFAFATFVIGCILFFHLLKTNMRELYRYILFSFIISVILYLFREYIFINSSYILICENDADKFICKLRDVIGYMVYNRILENIALVFCFVLLVVQQRVIGYFALFAALVSICFFNSNLGVVAFVFILFMVSKLENDRIKNFKINILG